MARPSAKPANKPAGPGTPPVHTIRYGKLRASIWKNEGNSGSFYSVTFNRSYRDSKNAWHDVNRFNAGDLPLLAKLANDCHSWIEWTQRQRPEKAKS